MATALAATNIMECRRMSAELVCFDEIKTFFEDGWIDEVLFPVKGGKEATVYCCKARPGKGEGYFALKIYPARTPKLPQLGHLSGGSRTRRCEGQSGGQKQQQVRSVR
jgi:serine/threonine-protein kinase RIO1